MKKMSLAYFLILIASLFCHSLFGDEMIVQLATEGKTVPICFVGIQESDSDFDTDYGSKLERVFRFDLNHTGRTELIQDSQEIRKHLNQIHYDKGNDSTAWKSLGVDYVIAGRIRHQTFDVVIFSTRNHFAKKIGAIPLTGDLSIDRRQIHRISDSLHQTLFGEKGIAESRILFTMRTKDEKSEWLSDVWEIDYDGANPRKISLESDRYCVTPSWVPPVKNGTSSNFLYVSYRAGIPKIFLGSLYDTKSTRLTSIKGNQLMPAISKQLDQIAFISDATGNPDLFVQEFNPQKGVVGKPRQIFSAPHATQGTPTFHPNGKEIAFVSNKDGYPRIYAMEIPKPGTPLSKISPQLISKLTRGSTSPSWSPDGKKIAYSSKVDGTRQIWIYDTTTQEEKQITTGKGHKENPSWAPNSLHLVYNTNESESEELYIIDINKLKPIRITGGIGKKRFPAWERY